MESSISVSDAIRLVSSGALAQLRALVNDARRLTSEQERKNLLLKGIEKIRHQLLRLLVAVKWTDGSSEVVSRAKNMLGKLESHKANIEGTADLLYLGHTSLTQDIARLPQLPVQLAGVVLNSGGPALPRAITYIGKEFTPPEEPEVTEALDRLNHVIRGRVLMSEGIDRYHLATVAAGQLHCRVENEFEMWLTLKGDADDTPWHILNLKILVESAEGRVVSPNQSLELLRLIQLKLAGGGVAPNASLLTIHEIAHSFCSLLQLDIVALQVRSRRHKIHISR